MRKFAWLVLFGAILVPAAAFADTGDSGKQVIVVQGGVTVPPPPTVVVGVEPPPAVVVTPVPPEPQPVYVQPPPQPQPVYAQPQPVYAVEAPEPETSPYNFVMTINPLFFWFGALHFELALGDWFALAAQLDFMYIGVGDWKLWEVGVFAGPNFYPGSRAPEGFFLGPRIGFDHFGWTDSGDNSIEVIRAGLALGYQWIFSSSFALAVGGGAAYTAVVASDGSSDSWIFDMVIPFFDFRLGFGV
jgi:hypothetical protein